MRAHFKTWKLKKKYRKKKKNKKIVSLNILKGTFLKLLSLNKTDLVFIIFISSKKNKLFRSILKNDNKENTRTTAVENAVPAMDLIFKYCDNIDLILLLIGMIASLAAAAIYPIMFLMYGSY